MNWFIGLVHDGHGVDALTRSVQALRDAGWSDPISVFSEPMRNAPRLAGVEYRFARNRLGAYANWRRALREAAKRVADRYLLVLTSAELDPSVRTVLEQTDGEADAYFPYTSEANYTAVFTWSERPHGMWFDRVGANPSGAHTLCISSLARVKKLDELLPANSWAGKTAEDLLLEHPDLRLRYYYPSLCWRAGSETHGHEFTALPLAAGRRRRKVFAGDKIRVGFVVQVLLVGGTETWLLNMLAGLARYSDIELSGVVVAGGFGAAAAITTTAVSQRCRIYTESALDNAIQSPSDAAIHELCANSDVVVAWAITDHADMLALAATDCRVVGANHGCFDWWMARINHFVDAWATVSEVSTRALPRPGRVIHNGLDFKPVTEGRADAKARLGLPANTFVCGYIGRLSPEKRIVEICRAFDRLAANKYSLLIVGPSSPVVDFTKFAANNFFVFPATTDVASYLAACDCTLLPSESEGFGFSALESILAGVPVVATRVGILNELMRLFPGAFSEIPQMENPADLQIGPAVTRARTHIEALRKHTALAASYVRRNLSLEKMTDSWRVFLREVCESPTKL